MDREIKFRAWDKMSEEMIQNVLYLEDQEHNSFGQVLKDDTKIVMQYTGLQDKDGQDIYEGDIMKWNDKKSLIVFKGGETNDLTGWSQFMGFVPKVIYDGVVKSFQMSKAKVIGNKFEDPELLENDSLIDS